MILTTPRLELGPPRAGDAELLYPGLVSGKVTDTILWDGPASLDAYRLSLERFARQHQQPRPEHFVLRLAATGLPIGTATLRASEQPGGGNLGYWVAESNQSRGFMTEAVSALVRCAFENLGMSQVDAFVFVGNMASRRVLEKNGFSLAGTLLRSSLKRGVWVDKWQFTRLQCQAGGPPATMSAAYSPTVTTERLDET